MGAFGTAIDAAWVVNLPATGRIGAPRSRRTASVTRERSVNSASLVGAFLPSGSASCGTRSACLVFSTRSRDAFGTPPSCSAPGVLHLDEAASRLSRRASVSLATRFSPRRMTSVTKAVHAAKGAHEADDGCFDGIGTAHECDDLGRVRERSAAGLACRPRHAPHRPTRSRSRRLTRIRGEVGRVYNLRFIEMQANKEMVHIFAWRFHRSPVMQRITERLQHRRLGKDPLLVKNAFRARPLPTGGAQAAHRGVQGVRSDSAKPRKGSCSREGRRLTWIGPRLRCRRLYCRQQRCVMDRKDGCRTLWRSYGRSLAPQCESPQTLSSVDSLTPPAPCAGAAS